eukprot:CAMPEP_0179611046 /NCGR_PEP_ID=MMETSP0930-20121108/3805_1 /TAXON_ID=548131 ORGANISM="Ostreococcus mediterraneus, Strain clade-D-RCC1621" /NCGR_SAMPLE_ID=MMETSP0930 /ASSEMBLY_ACC=CAM_ASM_000580 /LENGTH=71 /DNA_ID=CAMNT_0021479635 /DNA_START=63 /DNA_END=274 /DNA_ORIENTATION=+
MPCIARQSANDIARERRKHKMWQAVGTEGANACERRTTTTTTTTVANDDKNDENATRTTDAPETRTRETRR